MLRVGVYCIHLSFSMMQGVDWVREVHRHTSITKAGTNKVVFRYYDVVKNMIIIMMMFRNSGNEKVSSLDQLRSLLQQGGYNTDSLDLLQFISDKDHKIVSNKVFLGLYFLVDL